MLKLIGQIALLVWVMLALFVAVMAAVQAYAAWPAVNSSTVLTITSSTFASLGTPANGTIVFCTDCDPLVVLTCTSAVTKTGSLAIRLHSTWVCVGA